MWYLKFRQQHRLSLSGNRILRDIFGLEAEKVTGR
jgi:hypothetical protein